MKNPILLLTLLLSAYIIQAQNAAIKGRVLTEQGDPLPGVTVYLNNGKGTYTDTRGNFQLRNLEPGTYALMISFVGYEKQLLENIEVATSDQEVELPKFSLKESAVMIPEINVVSSYAPEKIYSEKQLTTSHTISKRELERVQPLGTEEMLKKVPGIHVAGDMGLSNRLNIGIRGAYPRRSEKMLILEDGTPIAPAPYLGPEMYYNPPSDRLDGIEVMKGADILTYGANTMYGVVNYVTKRPPVKPTLGINLTGGQNGYMSQFITYGGTWNKTGAELQVLNKTFDGFQENSQAHIFNTTLKIYSELTEKQSVYVKMNYHMENAKASYSSMTPLTYRLNPKANPFDADDLATTRYAIDLGHNISLSKNLTLSSKIYASRFQRNWWRQNNTLIKAQDAQTYLGEEIFLERYSYLQNQTFTDDDWIRVGRLVNGKESTTARNRVFQFTGVQETLKYNWRANEDLSGKMELGIRVHAEQFNDVEFSNDSSRFARSGKLIKDNKFTLLSYAAFLKHSFTYKKFTLSPSARFETLEMHKFDLLKISQNSANNGTKYFGSVKNTFTTMLGGTSAAYNLIQTDKHFISLYSGIYQGYTPPTAGYGFLTVEDGVVNTKPEPESPMNMKPEMSLNYEVGIRGQALNSFVVTQATWFTNNISNFYAAGRSEAFQSLGNIRIQGAELSMNLHLHNKLNMGKHELSAGVTATLMQSQILSGTIVDADLLKAKHTDAGKQEIIDKINASPDGYLVYVIGSNGKDSLVSRTFTTEDIKSIKKIEMVFGNQGIRNNRVPYVPEALYNFHLTYAYNGFSIGFAYNMVGAQYIDYINLETESAEGAMGKLPAYATIDAQVSYSFLSSKKTWLKGMTLFATGKNLTDEVFMASRLHRVSSGIMPGGFRQINGGIRWNF